MGYGGGGRRVGGGVLGGCLRRGRIVSGLEGSELRAGELIGLDLLGQMILACNPGTGKRSTISSTKKSSANLERPSIRRRSQHAPIFRGVGLEPVCGSSISTHSYYLLYHTPIAIICHSTLSKSITQTRPNA